MKSPRPINYLRAEFFSMFFTVFMTSSIFQRVVNKARRFLFNLREGNGAPKVGACSSQYCEWNRSTALFSLGAWQTEMLSWSEWTEWSGAYRRTGKGMLQWRGRGTWRRRLSSGNSPAGWNPRSSLPAKKIPSAPCLLSFHPGMADFKCQLQLISSGCLENFVEKRILGPVGNTAVMY